MRELSLNILDIVFNSTKAHASLVKIELIAKDNMLSLHIDDNGDGMDKDFLMSVTDPFTTTRTTRKVGLGLPLLRMVAEQSGGTFDIQSELGTGTSLVATFEIDNIDRPPLGDLGDTMVALLSESEKTDFVLTLDLFDKKYEFDTRELKQALGGIDVTAPEILLFVGDMLTENINEIGGNKL